jgi:heavy metal sensor kinase
VFILFYLLISSVIKDQIDQDLLGRANRFSRLLASNGMESVKREAIIEAQAAGEKKIFFRLVSQYGEVFYSSNMTYWIDIVVSEELIRKLLDGDGRVFETVAIPERRHKVRLLYTFIGTGVIIQLGQSMESQTWFIEAFKRIFIITMAIFVILAAVVGWFMAKRALSGLEKVRQTARNISDGSLKERVPRQGREDEIDDLANTINQMLDRIQRLVTGIKEMNDNIAHDLKSPIARIRGIAEITLTTEAPIDDYKKMAASTIEECDRLLDMINTMLLISKTDAGVEKLEYERMDLSQIISDACNLFYPLAEERDIALIWDVPDNCFIAGDIRMIQRMISNLLDNAIKYTQPDGSVNVNLNADDEESVIIAIKDSGIGISESDINLIFDRFYRVDPSRAQTGSGLGLSLAKAIALAHGGDITVISSIDEGSTFFIHLPKSVQSENSQLIQRIR